MVVVEFEYEEMKRLVDLPKEKMVASLSELGAPSEYEPTVKKIITELTPNRPDWYSMEGLARALKAYHGKKLPEYGTKKSDYTVVVHPSVATVRPYTVCAVVKDLKFDDQRIRDMVLLQEKLLATLGRKVKRFGLGIYPLHAIEFPVSYTTMKPEEIRYTPLGAEHPMSAKEILETHKKGQQYGYIIKDHDRYPVFVDAKGKVMALIPVVNSAETGRVDLDTKDVFIEVSGTDIHSCKAALNIIVCTFADMGGTIHEVMMHYGKEKFRSPDLAPKAVKISLKETNRLLGLELGESDMAQHLARMGYGYKKGIAYAPPYRADVMGPIDVIEDIAISYGYNNFKPTLPDFFCPGEGMRTHDGMDSIMRGMGFMEMKTFMLTNKEKLAAIGQGDGVIEITNPGSADYTVIRPSLMADMLDAFKINKMKRLPQRFYEIGLVQKSQETAKHLIFGVMDKKLEFADARGHLQALAAEMGIDFVLEKTPNPAFEPEISCGVMVSGKKVGVFGKINKTVLAKAGVNFDVYVCELELQGDPILPLIR
ncbi:phenylalanine--tRNA ligase subunit beta [Candidatus Micrarchaeota archaeon]|nr:phenylalanine--tRNA ligase subunit beta [Candidatus Micrarchaeota archaeon]